MEKTRVVLNLSGDELDYVDSLKELTNCRSRQNAIVALGREFYMFRKYRDEMVLENAQLKIEVDSLRKQLENLENPYN